MVGGGRGGGKEGGKGGVVEGLTRSRSSRFDLSVAQLQRRRAIDSTSGPDSSASVSHHLCTVQGCIACSSVPMDVLLQSPPLRCLSEDDSEAVDGLPPALAQLSSLSSLSSSLSLSSLPSLQASQASASSSAKQSSAENHVIDISTPTADVGVGGGVEQLLLSSPSSPSHSSSSPSSCSPSSPSSPLLALFAVGVADMVVALSSLWSLLSYAPLMSVGSGPHPLALFLPLLLGLTGALACFLSCCSASSPSRASRFIPLFSVAGFTIACSMLLLASFTLLQEEYDMATTATANRALALTSVSHQARQSLAGVFLLSSLALLLSLLFLSRAGRALASSSSAQSHLKGRGASMRRVTAALRKTREWYEQRRRDRKEREDKRRREQQQQQRSAAAKPSVRV